MRPGNLLDPSLHSVKIRKIRLGAGVNLIVGMAHGMDPDAVSSSDDLPHGIVIAVVHYKEGGFHTVSVEDIQYTGRNFGYATIVESQIDDFPGGTHSPHYPTIKAL